MFEIPAQVWSGPERPPDTFDPARRQHSSTRVLRWLVGMRPADADKILAITDVDLFIPILTFVFGEAQLDGAAAVVSTARLVRNPDGTPADRRLLTARLVKECVHELGHTFGLAPLRRPPLRDGALGRAARRGCQARRTVPGLPDSTCKDLRQRRGDKVMSKEQDANPDRRRRGNRPRIACRMAAKGRLHCRQRRRRAEAPRAHASRNRGRSCWSISRCRAWTASKCSERRRSSAPTQPW